MEKKPNSNRRSYFRLPLRSPVSVTLQRIGLGDKLGAARRATMLNISGRGCLVLGDQYPTRARLHLRFFLPGVGSFELKARVQRVAKSSNHHALGIAFEGLTEQDHERLLKFVASRQRQQLSTR